MNYKFSSFVTIHKGHYISVDSVSILLH